MHLGPKAFVPVHILRGVTTSASWRCALFGQCDSLAGPCRESAKEAWTKALSQLTSIQQGADTSTLLGRASTKGTVLAPELKEGRDRLACTAYIELAPRMGHLTRSSDHVNRKLRPVGAGAAALPGLQSVCRLGVVPLLV